VSRLGVLVEVVEIPVSGLMVAVVVRMPSRRLQ
jgi:hypothetical protein